MSHYDGVECTLAMRIPSKKGCNHYISVNRIGISLETRCDAISCAQVRRTDLNTPYSCSWCIIKDNRNSSRLPDSPCWIFFFYFSTLQILSIFTFFYIYMKKILDSWTFLTSGFWWINMFWDVQNTIWLFLENACLSVCMSPRSCGHCFSRTVARK